MASQQNRDKAWRELNRYRDAIERIAGNGPDDDDFDKTLVRKVFMVVRADLLLAETAAESRQ